MKLCRCAGWITGLSMAALTLLSGCSPSTVASSFDFSHRSDAPSAYMEQKSIYINNDTQHLTLDGTLEISSGEVSVEITDNADSQQKWAGHFTEDSSFVIELKDLKADTELTLTVRGDSCQHFQLALSSQEKLAKNVEKPAKKKGKKAGETPAEITASEIPSSGIYFRVTVQGEELRKITDSDTMELYYVYDDPPQDFLYPMNAARDSIVERAKVKKESVDVDLLQFHAERLGE